MITARAWGTTPDVIGRLTLAEYAWMLRQLDAESIHARRVQEEIHAMKDAP